MLVSRQISFLDTGENILVGSDGWGSEKTNLMFFGAYVLFGQKVGDDLRDAVYGIKEITTADGETVRIDVTKTMQEMIRAFRANNLEPGGIILTARAWEQLAEEEARKGKIRLSSN